MDGPLRRIFFLKMRASGAAKAGGGPSRRNRGMELLMRQQEGVRSAERTRTCRLTTAFPMRLPASLMETIRRYSWFCAGPAIAKNHGAVSTAQTGPVSAVLPFAKHAIGWDELITCMSRRNSSAGPMSSGEKLKSQIMRGLEKRRGGQRRQFPNTLSSYCGTASRKAKPVMRNHREIKPIFDELPGADGIRTRIPP